MLELHLVAGWCNGTIASHLEDKMWSAAGADGSSRRKRRRLLLNRAANMVDESTVEPAFTGD